jgi:MFS transporter, Spinster family, sphingosine-1-phosphate transporter
VAENRQLGKLVSSEEESAEAPAPDERRPFLARCVIRRSATIFWLMFAINALNYLDRFLVVAVGPILKSTFRLQDQDIGALASAFILIYIVAAVPAGLLSDRVARARVVAVGVALWSVASAATAFAQGFRGLFVSRAAVGVGEASYYPAGTALLSGHFPHEERARVMSRWQAGQILGLALAFALSAAFIHVFGEGLGWRAVFVVAGLPGLMLALLMWFVADAPATPVTASSPSVSHATTAPRGTWARVAAVLRLHTVWLVIVMQGLYFVIATPAITFLPIYLRSRRGPFHTSSVHTALIAGIILVLGGTAGVLLGGLLADRLGRRFRGSRMLAAALGFGCALPFFFLMLRTHSMFVFVVTGTLTVLLLNLEAGPLTAAVQDATPPALRATAVAVVLVCSHLLGDVWSPRVVGLISTALHERTGMALFIVGMPALAVAAVVGIVGARFYAAEDITDSGSADGPLP